METTKTRYRAPRGEHIDDILADLDQALVAAA
jgi:hypothetical protein